MEAATATRFGQDGSGGMRRRESDVDVPDHQSLPSRTAVQGLWRALHNCRGLILARAHPRHAHGASPQSAISAEFRSRPERFTRQMDTSSRHELDIFANAVDSLNEGLRKYQEAHAGKVGAYKFAVLHFSHFLELLFKHAVAAEHQLLIYKNPASKNLAKESTIGIWDSIAILKNAHYHFDPELLADIEWLKQLRNDIEHYKFHMEVRQVRAALGRILRASTQFPAAAGTQAISQAVTSDCRDIFNTLLDEYREQVANARADAKDEAPDDVTNCTFCGESEVAVERTTDIHCFFCLEDDVFHECVICGEQHRESEMTTWNNDDPSHVTYAGADCEEELFAKD